jgi:chemotaxis signal transduction protein
VSFEVHSSVTMARDAMHVVARVGHERFAFRVIDVEEAIDAPRLLRVPNAPAGLEGQFVHRSRTVSAFDSGWMFNVPRRRRAETALVLRVSDDRIALLVDDVEDLTAIEDDQLRAVPPGTDPSGLLRGVWLPPAAVGRKPSAVHLQLPLVCLVNAVAVMSRGASVVAPSLTHMVGA